MAQKIDFDINKLPWEAIARIAAPILAPIILAGAWVLLAKTNKTVDWLSNIFALAELVPAIDLNLPPGVVLGSFYNSAQEVESGIRKALEILGIDVPKLDDEVEVKEENIFTLADKLWDWFTFDIRKTEGFKERQ